MPRLAAPLLATSLLALGGLPFSLDEAPSPAAAGTTARDLTGPAVFVPNQGQWTHDASFVHRSGGMTVFLRAQGFTLDMPEGLALGFDFEGSDAASQALGEQRQAGTHNYFVGSDRKRWRTGVPVYGAVRYEELYRGIDLRMRHAAGVPEYDLLVQPGSNLREVRVRVAGCERLSIDAQGDLLVHTSRGILRQPRPKTWQTDTDGREQEVDCAFRLLGDQRFGFVARAWNPSMSLTVDPGLLWSTHLGGSAVDRGTAIHCDAKGIVTVAGYSYSADFPTSTGAYDPSQNGAEDMVISRLDPEQNGAAQLISSTFVGGSAEDRATGVTVAGDGRVYVCGTTKSADMPTTSGAYDKSHERYEDGFVVCLDPSKAGQARLAYASYYGGNSIDKPVGIHVDGKGRVTMQGETYSSNLPSSSGAYASSGAAGWNLFAARLDPSQAGTGALVYASYLGGSGREFANSLAVDEQGVITLGGYTDSGDYPTTAGALGATRSGVRAMVVSQLDPSKTGAAQLVYSTHVGGSGDDRAFGISAAGGRIAVGGFSDSTDLPLQNAYAGSNQGGTTGYDAYVAILDPSKSGAAQLAYGSYFGGSGDDRCYDLHLDADGVLTLTGETYSKDLPTTADAMDRSLGGSADLYVARLDTRAQGVAQLRHSTYFGNVYLEAGLALHVDAGMVASITGVCAGGVPTSPGAYDSSYNGNQDAFVLRMDLGSQLRADLYELSLSTGGTQNLSLDAGKAMAGMRYAIFGSATGTHPGIKLGGVQIPLNYDAYTDITIGSALPPVYFDFAGKLDQDGKASAAIKVPSGLKALPFTLHHAYLVVDAQGRIVMASNAVPLLLNN